MSVLASEELVRRLRGDADSRRRLVISPIWDISEQLRLGTASVDVRLGQAFVVHRRAHVGSLDPGEESSDEAQLRIEERITIPFGESFTLHPNQFTLGSTIEYFGLPGDLSGYVVGKSSWGRLGLTIATAIGIHPHYRGVITLELRNVGEVPVSLYPGAMIAQVFFHDVREGVSEAPEPGRYQLATGPEHPVLRLHDLVQRLQKLRGDS